MRFVTALAQFIGNYGANRDGVLLGLVLQNHRADLDIAQAASFALKSFPGGSAVVTGPLP